MYGGIKFYFLAIFLGSFWGSAETIAEGSSDAIAAGWEDSVESSAASLSDIFASLKNDSVLQSSLEHEQTNKHKDCLSLSRNSRVYARLWHGWNVKGRYLYCKMIDDDGGNRLRNVGVWETVRQWGLVYKLLYSLNSWWAPLLVTLQSKGLRHVKYFSSLQGLHIIWIRFSIVLFI